MFSLFGKSWSPDKDIPSLDGKVILVTGGNAGLGKETVLQLAKHAPKSIFIAARTPSKADAAIAQIKQSVPDAKLEVLQLDLTSFKSVEKAAEEFKSRSDRLDILINNAGIMAVPYSKTQEGYEIQFGTNHMGHALLTKLLLPTLLKTAEKPDSDVRVINLSSEGHQMAPSAGIIYDQAELEKCATWQRYGQAKLANILHARALQKHYPSITATSIHPGVIITDLYNTMSETNMLAKPLVWTMRGATAAGLLYDVPKGAYNSLWAATAPRDVVKKTWYWKPVGVQSGGSFWHAQKEDLSEKLWEWTEGEFKKHGY